ncbi:MAG: alpha/beta fold hydrolase [Actinobacteria bacterium]|nr:alpha/beta fold hydrolase [Actinomycetota bacterium]
MNVVGLSLKRMSEGVLPPGRALDLQGRGTGYVYAAPAPPGAPTLVLVHGLWATGSLNWFPAFEALSSRFGVVATDLRGHGRGIPVSGHFRVADCADDIAALVDELGTGPVILVGYSLGGVVAQMAWRRHPRCVAGLVLCATSRNFGGSRPERIFYRSLSGALFGASMLQRARQRGVALPPAVEAAAVAAVDEVATVAAEVGAVGATGRRMPAWAWDEMKRTDVLASLGAVAAIGRFSSREWVHEIDVPTAVVVTARDHFISPVRQRKLAAAIPGATVYEVPSDHAACVLGAEHFVPALVDACTSVATRVAARAA